MSAASSSGTCWPRAIDAWSTTISIRAISWAVPGALLVEGDLADRTRLADLLASRRFAAVVHCAAHIWVGESVREPARYYANNTANAIGLFDLCARHSVGAVVFSLTAAVYGEPDRPLIDETQPLAPINPYGASKMMSERVLADIAAANGLRYAILRYFNVAGADDEARIVHADVVAPLLQRAAPGRGRRPACA